MVKVKKTNKKELSDYREFDGLNYSQLSKLKRGNEFFLLFKNVSYVSDSIRIGNIVDSQLTLMDDDYIILDKLPSASEMQVVEILKSLKNDVEILKALDEIDWRKSWKDGTRVKKAKELFALYGDIDFDYVISTKENELVDNIIDSVNKNDLVKTNVLLPNLMARDDLKEVHFQKPVFAKYGDITLKGLPDIVLYKKDGSIDIIDIKTHSGLLSDFAKSYKRFGYWIQAHMYKKILSLLNPSVDVTFYFAVLSYHSYGDITTFNSAMFRDIAEVDIEFQKLFDKWMWLKDKTWQEYYKETYSNYVDINLEGSMSSNNQFSF